MREPSFLIPAFVMRQQSMSLSFLRVVMLAIASMLCMNHRLFGVPIQGLHILMSAYVVIGSLHCSILVLQYMRSSFVTVADF